MFEEWKAAIEGVQVAVEATDPDALDGSGALRLTALAAEGERRCAAAKARLARRVEELGTWKRSGHRSSVEWLAATSGSTLGQAVGALQTARHLEDLPETAAAFEAGQLSEAQAREVAAAAIEDPDAERELLRAAKIETVKGLRERARAVRAAATDPQEEAERYERIRRSRYLRNWTDHDGAVRIDARLTPDDGGRLIAAVDAHAKRIGRTGTAQGRREPAEAYRADGLVALARPGAHAPAAAVQVVIDAAALRRGHTVNGETCEIRGIGPVPVAAARRLLNDCILTAVVRDGVDVATIAHQGRTIPAALRRALEQRDPICDVPGCDVRDHLEIDPTPSPRPTAPLPLEDGGITTIRNLCRLCDWHHFLKTHRGYRLRGSPGDRRWEAPARAKPPPAPPQTARTDPGREPHSPSHSPCRRSHRRSRRLAMPACEPAARACAGAKIRGPDDAARVLLTALGTGERDRHAVLALSADRRIVSLAVPDPHDATSSIIVRSVVEIAEQCSATTIVLATQRRGEPARPTPGDVDRFLEVQAGCTRHGVLVVDWLILRQHHWWSLHELAEAST